MKLDGIDELLKKLDAIEDQKQIKINRFVAQEGEILKALVAEKTPVDTGLLREGWKRSRVAQGRTEVFNNTEYANHVEYGHRTRGGNGFVKGRKMLHRGLLEFSKTYKDHAEKVVKDILDTN